MSLFPSLPSRDVPWPPNILRASQTLRNQYDTTTAMLNSGNLNEHRIEHHIRMITEEAFPLILALDSERSQSKAPPAWIETVAELITGLIDQLVDAHKDRAIESANVHIPQVVTAEQTGHPGQPRKIIDLNILEEAMAPHRRITKKALAVSLGVSINTLKKRLKEADIDTSYSDITDDDLDAIILTARLRKPLVGRSYLEGYLRTHGLRIPERRLRDAIKRVDNLGQVLRRRGRARVTHREYRVSRPNALWHLDGHHKLILWGVVIHGVVDGYSRKITGMRASTNNRASTVLDMFLDAVLENGIPSRVRGDRGGENRDVSIFMILVRGLSRASFMWGSSVFNTRIERLWVEVGRMFVRAWRAFFYRLERLHNLQRDNPHHLWLLHELFLKEINADCDQFKNEWNAHPVSGRGKNQTPNDMFFLGQLQNGVYDDEFADMDPDEIHRFFGVDHPGIIDAEAPSDPNAGDIHTEETSTSGDDSEDDDEGDEYSHDPPTENDYWEASQPPAASDGDGASNIESDRGSDNPVVDAVADVEGNIQHEAVPVPKHSSPFENEADEVTLWEHILSLEKKDAIPPGFYLDPEEWDEDGYPSVEVLTIGPKGKSKLLIDLPDEVWRPRALRWARSLYILESMLYDLE